MGAIAACCLLLAGGAGQWWLERVLVAVDAAAVKLDQPLSTLPLRLGEWEGTEIPLDKRVIEVAGADDHVSRRYVKDKTGEYVDLYVSYAARPAKMLSHRPEVCYVAHGWMHVETRPSKFVAADGRTVNCLVHRFARQDPFPQTVVVLNYYILRGRYTTEWTDFWGPEWRLPNLSRDPNFYVAQVQLSTGVPVGLTETTAENLIRALAARVAPEVDRLIPREENNPSSRDRQG